MDHACLYRNELIRLRHGNPVWEPDPDNLYDRIKIGDVGCFDNDRFMPLFSILPLDDSNRNRHLEFPQSDFEVLALPDNVRTTHHRNPLQAGVHGHESNLNISAAMEVDSVGSVLQGGSSLSFTNEKGAALILPTEALREDTFYMKSFKRHMLKYYREWYNFASNICDIKLHDLILVTGCDLTRQWTTVTYFRNNGEASATLKTEVNPVAKVKFSLSAGWSTTQPMNTRQGPPQASQQQSLQDNDDTQNDSETLANNQCIFLRGLYVKERLRVIPQVMKAGAGYHNPGKYGPDEEEAEGVLGNEDVTVESLLPSTQDETFMSVLLDYMLEESDADVVIANDLDLWPYLEEAENPEKLRDTLKRISPFIKVEDRVGSLVMHDDETTLLPRNGFHPWRVESDDIDSDSLSEEFFTDESEEEPEEAPPYQDPNLCIKFADQIMTPPSHRTAASSRGGRQTPLGAHPVTKSPPSLFALIIGIDEYESTHVGRLSGAVQDADAVRYYLREHLGVPSSQIMNLRNSDGTRAAIIDGINAFSLNDEIKKGDPILIYYAGHGGSTADASFGWVDGSTGKMSFLIPYDAKHVIPNRTLRTLLSRLAIKKGDNITVILDCSYSGSGPRNYNHSCPRSHVLLAACGSEECALEVGGRGIFTQRLLEALTTLEIDKLTYTGLLQRMPSFPRGQNPQCEGVNQNRIIFSAEATSKLTVYYKIHGGGEGYVMPGVGAANGISLGAEFEVYQDQDSGHLLGVVVAKELSPFSTTLYAKEPIVLEGDGVALQTSAGTEEHALRIHVADEGLRSLIKKIGPSHRIIQLVERDQAEFSMALEDGKVVFDILDSLVTKYGLIRMPFRLEPTLEAISRVLRAADHFYWHLRRTSRMENDISGVGLADVVEIQMAEMEYDGTTFDEDFEPVLSPTKASWKGGKVFDLQINDRGIYGWKIINKKNVDLYPSLFYFNNSDWSITSYCQPPTARGIVEPPLKGRQFLLVGCGDSGSGTPLFFLREGQNVDVGILKLFLSREPVNLSDVAQSSPFDCIEARHTTEAKLELPTNLPSRYLSDDGARSTIKARWKLLRSSPLRHLSDNEARYTAEAKLKSRLPTNLSPRLLWDTILVPVVQRRVCAAR